MNQKKLSNSTLERIYDALEGEKVVIRRIFDRRFTASCDDLIIAVSYTHLTLPTN